MTLASLLGRKRRPRVLLAWEIGAGVTHAQSAAGIVAHLAANGVSCFFAAADPRFEPWFRAAGCPVVQTWLWPPMRTGAALPAQRDPRTLPDMLANYGAIDPANLAAGIAHYDALFDLVKPDLLLCDNAFAALLAARGRIPAIVYGSTLLFMPPVQGGRLAPVDPADPAPAWPEDDVLDAIAAALGASARPPLTCAADIMACEAVMPFGPAAFDPYAHARATPLLPPYCPDLPSAPATSAGREIFVYLHESAQFSGPLMAALARLPPPLRVYIPALTRENRNALEKAGAQVETRMHALSDIARARCLVHHGGVTLTAAALALGAPQAILARFHDNAVAGQFVADRDLGLWMRADEFAADRFVEGVRAVLDDPLIALRAKNGAGEFRAWFSGDPTFAVARRAGAALGLKEMRAAPSRGLRDIATF